MQKEIIFLAMAFSSVQFSHLVMSDSLQPHELQLSRPPCPSPTPRAYPNSCPLSWWCHTTISSSVVPFFSCPQSFPAWGPFQMSQLFASGGQSIGVSASTSVLPMNTQDWSPLGWTGWISLQSKGLYGFSGFLIWERLIVYLGLPRWPSGKEFAWQAGHWSSIPGLVRACRRKWQFTPVFLPGKIPWTENPGGL